MVGYTGVGSDIMPVLTFNDKYLNNDIDINFFRNENKYNITSNIIIKLKNIVNNKKILYFNLSYSEEELLKKFKFLNNKNIIIINKFSITIDDLGKYLDYSKPDYICIDYFKMIDKNSFFIIKDKSLKYVLDKIEEYNKKYGVIFIVAINFESK